MRLGFLTKRDKKRVTLLLAANLTDKNGQSFKSQNSTYP
jgi:hypothetical protein